MRRALLFLPFCLLLACVADESDAPDEELVDLDEWAWDDGSDGELHAATTARVDVHPGATSHAELVDTLPVGRSESGANRRVVMRLGPAQLPSLARGDTLIVAAEVEVTTRCDVGQSAPGCGYDPRVAAQLVLTGSPGDTDPAGAGSRALTPVKTLTCNKNEHHCLISFRPGETAHALDGGFALPCLAGGSCSVNLVMWSWHPDARAGGADKLLVGGNEGNYLANGVVDGDKGRLMVVRERGVTGADRLRSESSGGGARNVPTDARPVLVYSHRLKPGDLRAGEQFLVEAKLVADVSSRARVSTEMFLSKDPNATDGNGLGKVSPGEIGEHNGINCTPGASPCTLRKVAVFRVDEEVSGPVYLNVIVKSAVPGGGGARVTMRRDDGFVRVTRYRAALGR